LYFRLLNSVDVQEPVRNALIAGTMAWCEEYQTTTTYMASAVVHSTTTDQKAAKLERQHAKNRQYLLTPKDHKERVVDPLVKRVSKLLDLALVLGKSATPDGDVSKADTTVNLIRDKFNSFKEDYVKSLRRVGTYYNTLYKVNGKRAEKAAKGEAAKPRQQIMFRSISSFQSPLYSFVKAASQTHESLRVAGQCSTFDSNSPLQGYMSSVYAAQFILAYVATHRRLNKVNGQYIQPDDLMKKHLGEGINKVLEDIRSDTRDKEVEKAKKFPGEFSFVKLQALIGFYRVKPAEGSPAEAALQTLRKDDTNWPTLRSEFEALSTVRQNAYERRRAENPKAVTVGGKKGPRGPLSEEKKTARRIKREATAFANSMGMELTLQPRAVKSAPAVAAV
jgi:hypothetical protein